jgi:hypothetical protein
LLASQDLYWRYLSDDSISAIGDTEEDADSLTMHCFVSRGVFRVYRLCAEEDDLTIWRDHLGLRQRFTRRFNDDGAWSVPDGVCDAATPAIAGSAGFGVPGFGGAVSTAPA